MDLKNDRELANTQEKLRRLEQRYAEVEADAQEDERIREWTLISLKKMINQMTEEVVRYQCRQRERSSSTSE